MKSSVNNNFVGMKNRGSMVLVQIGGPWTQSKEVVHEPRVQVLSSPVTACKSSRGQKSYLRVLNVFLLAKNIACWKNKRKILLQNLLFLKKTL